MKLLVVLILLLSFSTPALCYDLYDKKSILILIKTPINSADFTKKNDRFSAKIVEDLNFNEQIVIPKGSHIHGKVTSVSKINFFRADAAIKISIREITMPNGQMIVLNKKPLKFKLINPKAKYLKKKALDRLPIILATYGTSIPLNAASSLSNGAVYGISILASMVGGLVSGFIGPDYGYNRSEGAILRCSEATPMGLVMISAEKGYNVDYCLDSYAVLNLQNKQREQIMKKFTDLEATKISQSAN